MFFSGDTLSIPDDRSSAIGETKRQPRISSGLARMAHGLKRALAGSFRTDRRELRQIANDPRMLDDIGLTRADVERLLHRERGLAERYPNLY